MPAQRGIAAAHNLTAFSSRYEPPLLLLLLLLPVLAENCCFGRMHRSRETWVVLRRRAPTTMPLGCRMGPGAISSSAIGGGKSAAPTARCGVPSVDCGCFRSLPTRCIQRRR